MLCLILMRWVPFLFSGCHSDVLGLCWSNSDICPIPSIRPYFNVLVLNYVFPFICAGCDEKHTTNLRKLSKVTMVEGNRLYCGSDEIW